MKPYQYYLRFLNVLHALESDSELPLMDLECRRLLEEIAVRQHDDQTMTVTEVMALANIASPATLHRKLNQLITVNLVEAAFEGSNRRTKYMKLTSQGVAYFRRLSQAMQTAVQG